MNIAIYPKVRSQDENIDLNLNKEVFGNVFIIKKIQKQLFK